MMLRFAFLRRHFLRHAAITPPLLILFTLMLFLFCFRVLRRFIYYATLMPPATLMPLMLIFATPLLLLRRHES